MYHIEWQDVDPELVPRMVAEIQPKFEGVEFDPNMTVIKKHDLPFYADISLIEITDNSKDPAVIKRALYGSETVAPLNWTNQPIYSTNETAPISLSNENIPAYVKFFFDFVRGRHGRFLIVENPQEVNWKGTPPEKGVKALEKMITPLVITEEKPEGTVTLSSYMVFKDSLFKADVHVEKDGMVSLSNEQLVVEGMPIHEDPAPGENFAEQ